MKRNILCRLFGHKWAARPGNPQSSNPKDWFVEYCGRCGENLE